MRFEWLEIIIRIAFAKYLDTDKDEFDCGMGITHYAIQCSVVIDSVMKVCCTLGSGRNRATELWGARRRVQGARRFQLKLC
jgi:hypothetical protein